MEDLSKELDIYTFHNKTLAERLDEYLKILSTCGKIIPAREIQAEWSSDVEIVIEKNGWQAMWKISHCTCEEQNIPYPTIVLVEVLKMKYSTLHAEVKIVAVMDNINLPEKYEVPLIELYPTINQKDKSLDIEGIAHCIDRLRFFYHHLWMPWDEDDDEHVDWVERHLEPRIRLFSNMTYGFLDMEIYNIIKSLTNEAKVIKQKLPIILNELSEEKWNDKKKSEDYLELESTRDQFRFRLQQIKAEMDLLEIFPIREQLRRNLVCSKRVKMKSDNNEKTYYFVWLGGTVKELQKLSNKIQEMFSEDTAIKVCKYLEEALDVFKENDIILLGEGHHTVDDSSGLESGLEKGGSIIGICNADNIILHSSNFSTSSMFDFFGTEVLLKNISIELDLQTCIVVRKKCTVIVTDCRLYVPNTTSNNCTFGVVVMPDGKLVLDNTVFQGLGTAIVLYSTGKVVMDDCRFEKCDNGIRLQDNAHLDVTKCSFENTGDPIVMETEKVTHSKSVPIGDKLLTSMKKISLNTCKFSTNNNIVKLRPKGITDIIN